MEATVFVRDKATLTTVMQFIRGKFVYLILLALNFVGT